MDCIENCCQLCAVSLNIVRLRTKDEPESAGWNYAEVSDLLPYSKNPLTAQCTIFSEKSGCENVAHEEAKWLHFPGRGCVFLGGYSGWKIDAEEMEGMRFPRYIVKRPNDMEFDGEGAEYEKESDYFITSQTSSAPDNFDPGDLEHVRYGIDNFFPQNFEVMGHYHAIGEANEVVGVPIHDACWKIFEHVCNLRLGTVDLQGFMALWLRQACGMCGFQNMKQEPLIKECRDEWWLHLPGTEYLAANPHDVPGLLLGLLGEYKSYPDGDNVFDTSMPVSGEPIFYENPTDSFAQFPAELRNMVLSYLPSKDIANLRLASRSFRQLPKRLFLRLIQEELPWFWEFEELKRMDNTFWKEISKEDDPEGSPNEEQANIMKRSREGNFTEQVNWLMIYKQLCVLKKGVHGLRNRARIWYLVEEVVQRIADLRETLIDPDGYNLEAGEYFPVDPTTDEVDAGLVKNGVYCPRCQFQRKM